MADPTPPEAAPMREDVTQADRDTAAMISERLVGGKLPGMLKGGRFDDNWIIEAIHSNRLTQTARPDAGTDFYAGRYAERCGDVLRLQCELAEVRAALAGIADDFMTSESHHPGYVLIPTAKFEQLRAAAEKLVATKEDRLDAGDEVERVARAIYEADDPWHKAWEWPNLDQKAQGGESAAEKYRDIARAALAAMREGVDRGMVERVVQAARTYYEGYAQDEADDEAVENTGCSEEQHSAACELRDALAALARKGG